jgi:hypothetical protein
LFNWWESTDDKLPIEEEREFKKELRMKAENDIIKVVCSQCGCTIVEHNKDKVFNGVDLCAKCFAEYINSLMGQDRDKKINIYD